MTIARLLPTSFVFILFAGHLCRPVWCAAAEPGELAPKTVAGAEGKAEKPQPDDRTPEAAVRSFFTAIADGDAEAAVGLAGSPEETREWIEVQVSVSNAFRHLGKAAIARFGDEGKLLQVRPPAEVIVDSLATKKLVENGDSAEWWANPKSQAPLKLIRVDGHWKVQIISSFPSAEKVAEYNVAHRSVANLLERYAKRIEDGRYASVAEVRADMNKKPSSGKPGDSK